MKNFYRRERKAWFVARARHSCSQIPLSSTFIPLCQRGKEGDFPGRKGKTSTDSALCAFARVTLVSLRRRRGVR